MDEALKKIEQALRSERPVSRLNDLLPQSKETARTPEQDMGITHYAKAPAETAPAVEQEAPQRFETRPEADPAARIGVGARVFTLEELGAASQAGPAPAGEPEATSRPGPRPENDPAARIGVGAREFSLDELGSGPQPNKDPLMGQVLKSPSFREMTLDDLGPAVKEGN